jgi:uncharacterized membrane protein YebE (DUF533 family)
MFDARKLLDALVAAAAQFGQPTSQQSSRPAGQGAQPQGHPHAQTKDPVEAGTIAGQVDQTLRQVTGQGTDQLVQKAKDVMTQNPALAPAVMVGLAGLFSAKRRSRGMPGGGLVKLGGLALIGTLAYKAYQNRQAGKPLLDMGGAAGNLAGTLGAVLGGNPQQAPGGSDPASSPAAASQGAISGSGVNQGSTPDTRPSGSGVARPFETLEVPQNSGFHPASQTEDDALLYLRAMVAAASSDGHIDEAERTRIVKGLAEAGIDPEATRWLERELASPADVEELSANVNTPEKAAQVYAAARIAIDPDTMQEREFLNRLAESLDIDQATRAQIDDTASTVARGV